MKRRPIVSRTFPLEDIEIMRSGDGRTVRAYAATFDTPYEVRDYLGHYDEMISRSAFNRTLAHSAREPLVLFNHGRGLDMQPSERWSMPIGKPLEIKADARGLLTVTRYAQTELGDEVLALIRDGIITAQSFQGPIIKRSRGNPGPNGRQVFELQELGLRDYGPAVRAANPTAEILSVRSVDLAEEFDVDELLETLDDEQRKALAERLADPPGTRTEEVDPPELDTRLPAGPSLDLLIAQAAQRRRRAQV